MEYESNNFIEDIIIEDLKTGKHNKIITRFPPEPNGYLHIGHAKSICLNFGIKAKFGGECNLRYDDTNPVKEEDEYVKSIEEDIKWLGFEWDRKLFASDYFEIMYEKAELLITKGLAYVCDLTADEIRATRGTLTEPGSESPYRGRSIKENLDLFRRMRDGEFADGEKVLRAKIDMASNNINMRDPVIYRILREEHHRTKSKWIIYPMYDFAHPLEDAIENITHSICTLEFEDHRPLYDWFKINSGYIPGPRQIEFARLNLTDTVMSKRYLKKLVDDRVVSGWSDPRMPTISGMRRRGYTAEAIKDFCSRIGVSKANSEIESEYLDHCVREQLNRESIRLMCVSNPIKVKLLNVVKDEILNISNSCSTDPEATREVHFSNEIYIDGSDFSLNPPPKYKRFVKNGKIRLIGAYIIEYVDIKFNDKQEIDYIEANIIENSKSGQENAKVKVKGAIQWVSARKHKDIICNEYKSLFYKNEKSELINREKTHSIIECKMEDFAHIKPYDRFQFMRKGYYMAVDDYSDNNKQFNLVVALKSSFKF